VLAVVRAAVWWVGGVEVEGVNVGAKWIKGEDMVGVEREREVVEGEVGRKVTACMPGLVDATQNVMID
jgi:hypothetical protein